MKLLLDMYKSAPKEQRDKVQLMAAERKSKAEVIFLKIKNLTCKVKWYLLGPATLYVLYSVLKKLNCL